MSMKLTIIGKYGPYPSNGGGLSCYLLESESTAVALDFGSGAISGIQKYIPLSALSAIVLSHLHYDHSSDILPLTYSAFHPPVYCPFDDGAINKILCADKAFALNRIESAGQKETNIGGLSFRFFRMPHSAESYAMRVTDGQSVFVYTGDCTFTPDLYDISQRASYVLMDCGGGQKHASLSDAERLADALPEAQIIATHFFPGTEYKTAHPRVQIAEEGRTYRV